jgi:serine phosphatase RsbU (regulator of sigma subunit)
MPELAILAADGTRSRFPVDKPRVTVGRSRESDIFLPDQWLSRHHAEIRVQTGGACSLVDLGSKNGTLLNGARVDAERVLRHGDVITLGEHVLTFIEHEGDEAEDDYEPAGTRVFSASDLSDVALASSVPAEDAESLVRRNRMLGILTRSASALIAHRPLGELFDTILDLLFDALPVERGAILLVEGSPPRPAIKASRSRRGETIGRISGSIARRVLSERVALLLPNLLDDAAFKTQDSILASGIRSALCAPLLYRPAEGSGTAHEEVIGLVYLDTLQRSHPFGDEDIQLLTALANIAAAKIENVRLLEESLEKRALERDLQVAAEIQTSLLPRRAPAVPGYALCGSNRPCHTIGGDYFDFDVADGRLLLALGDVSGKGTGAALLMTVLRVAVRGHWADAGAGEAMARINRTVCQNIPEGKYITFFMARLDPASGRLDYVNAGHNPPVLVRADGKVDLLTEGGMVLGLIDPATYDEGHVELRPGDTLVVYSDGVTETWNAEDEEFGEQGLLDVVRRHVKDDAQSLQDALLMALEHHAPGAKATDDRTLIVLKREP